MSQFYLLNGAERLAVELAVELNKLGIHADILSMYSDDLAGVAEQKQALINRGIPRIHFLGMKIHPSLPALLPAIGKLRHLLRGGRYDIVETSTVSPTVLAAWATMGLQTRHVAGLHRAFRKDRENTKQHVFWRFSIRCNRRTRFYGISDHVVNCWLKYSRTMPRRTRKILNAIPDHCFLAKPDRAGVRAELGISQKDRICIFVGRLVAFKGIDTILEALGPVLEKQRLVILYVGLADLNVKKTKETLLRMQQWIDGNHWADRVKFLGFRKDVPRLMASSDVLVHPARIEGFGLVLAEAMAVGLPIVASHVEGIPEVLGQTGYAMVPPNAPDVLREAVLDTLNRPDAEKSRLVGNGKMRAEDFRIVKRSQAMIRLFRDVSNGGF